MNPLKWKSLGDLKGKRIGVVIDYGNTADFNAIVAEGLVRTEAAKDDETNIRKVMGGRLDGAFIDLVNGRYLIAKMGVSAEAILQINDKVVAKKVFMWSSVKRRKPRLNCLIGCLRNPIFPKKSINI